MTTQDMSNEQYHAQPALGSSGIKLLLKRSPHHYWSEYLDPARIRTPPTKSMQFGTALHTAILEPHLLNESIAILPEDAPDKRTKAGKEWWANYYGQINGRVLLTQDEYVLLLNTRDAVLNHSVARGLIEECERERSFFWRDPIGINCKARPDAIKKDRSLIVDLKSTDDASLDAFARTAAQYLYHVQAAWYTEGIAVCETTSLPTFVWIAVERSHPHGVGVYLCDAPTLRVGMELCERARRLYAECVRSNNWPSYPQNVQPLNLPRWAMRVDGPSISSF